VSRTNPLLLAAHELAVPVVIYFHAGGRHGVALVMLGGRDDEALLRRAFPSVVESQS